MDPRERGLRDAIAVESRQGGDWQTPTLILADLLEQELGRDDEAASLRSSVGAAADAGPPAASDWPRFLQSDLTPHQIAAANRAASQRLGILIGGPGTGKTRVIASLVKEWPADMRHRLALCAPTGRAAVRISESMEAAGVAWDVQPRTIHQTLGIGRNGHDGRGWGFAYDRDNPLPHRFVIVDEASMLDANLAGCLLQAVRDGGHVLLVGDPGQLPPVGHGAPLRDLIAAGVPVGELTEIHRNAGLIARTCAAIRAGRGQMPLAAAGEPDNLHWIDCPARQVEEAAVEHASRWRPATCQVLCATNEQRKRLNARLGARLNPGAQRSPKRVAEPGDKVLCAANGWYPGPGGSEYVANGELGRCVEGAGAHLLTLQFGPRTVAVPHALVGDAFSLGYAITGHKSQGSQWDTTIVAADDSPAAGRICTREWWYTVLSRAALACYVVGPRDAVARQCQRESTERRLTFLRELLEAA